MGLFPSLYCQMIPSPGEGLETVQFHCSWVALCSIHSVSFYIYCYVFSKDLREHPIQILNLFPVTWNSATSISHSLIDCYLMPGPGCSIMDSNIGRLRCVSSPIKAMLFFFFLNINAQLFLF